MTPCNLLPQFIVFCISLMVVVALILHFITKEDDDMVAVYVALIIAGRRTFDSVPAKLQPAVKEALEAIGLDENGNPA